MPFFGFFGKKKKEPPEMQAFEVSLADLPEWFDKAMGEEIKNKRQESEGIYSRILERFSDIRQSLDKLDRARMSGGERVHIAANMIKESFVRKNYNQLNSLASFYQQNYRPDYEYFMAFQERGMKAIKELKESTPKQAILLSRYFKRESGELVDSIKQAEELLQHFREFLGAGSGAMGTKGRVREMARSCKGLREEMERLDSRASGLREEAARSRERRAELERNFLELLKSSEWSEFNRLSNEIVKVRDRLADAELRISTELSSLRRPLKKLEHSLVKAGKTTPMQRNTLQDFIRNPLKAIMSEKGEKELHKTLKSLRRQMDIKKLELKDKEQLRVDGLMERLERGMPELKSEYMELKDTLEKTESQLQSLSRLSRNKEGLEAQIGRISEDAGKTEDELREIASRKSRAREQLDDKIRDIEAVIMEEAQKKVTIKL
jgi:chromosome segregation ATPase